MNKLMIFGILLLGMYIGGDARAQEVAWVNDNVIVPASSFPLANKSVEDYNRPLHLDCLSLAVNYDYELEEELSLQREGDLDFRLDKSKEKCEQLLAGTIFYSKQIVLDQPEKVQTLLENFGLRDFLLNEEGIYYSYSKTVYIIPNAKSKDFSKKLSINANYVKQTNLNTINVEGNVDEQNNYVVSSDKVLFKLIFKTVTSSVRMIIPSHSPKMSNDKVQKMTWAELLMTGESSTYVRGIRSINFYQNLPNNKGVVVTTYNFAVVDTKAKTGLGFILGQAISRGQDVKSFEEETIYSVKQNIQYFAEHSKE